MSSVDPKTLSEYHCGVCSKLLATWEDVIGHQCLHGCTKLSVDKKTGAVNKNARAVAPSTNPAATDVPSSDQGTTGWSDGATKYLLELYRDRKSDFENKNILKKPVWNDVANAMKAGGYAPFSHEQVISKWKGLLRTYRSIKTDSKVSCGNRRQWKYFEVMDELLGKSVVSQLSDSSQEMDSDSESGTQSRSCSPLPPKASKKRRMSTDEILLRAIKERRLQHAQDLAAKRRFNDLFEQLVNLL